MLYCFPHAGASSSVYRPWQELGAPLVTVQGVDSPGRGMRAREPRAAGFQALVDAMTDYVVDDLRRARQSDPDARYLMFGHSFGTLVSLSVAAAVTLATGQAPVRAVLSAGLPPRLHTPVNEAASLRDDELISNIAAGGGTPAQLLSGGPLTRHIVRLFREDYAVRSQFCLQAGLRVDFPVTLIAARDDPFVRPEQMWAWSEHSTVPARQEVIPGGHFAAFQEPEQVLQIICDDLHSATGCEHGAGELIAGSAGGDRELARL